MSGGLRLYRRSGVFSCPLLCLPICSCCALWRAPCCALPHALCRPVGVALSVALALARVVLGLCALAVGPRPRSLTPLRSSYSFEMKKGLERSVPPTHATCNGPSCTEARGRGARGAAAACNSKLTLSTFLSRRDPDRHATLAFTETREPRRRLRPQFERPTGTLSFSDASCVSPDGLCRLHAPNSALRGGATSPLTAHHAPLPWRQLHALSHHTLYVSSSPHSDLGRPFRATASDTRLTPQHASQRIATQRAKACGTRGTVHADGVEAHVCPLA